MPRQSLAAAPPRPYDDVMVPEAIELLDSGLTPGRAAQRMRISVRELARLAALRGVTVIGSTALTRTYPTADVDFDIYARIGRGEPLTSIAIELDVPVDHVIFLRNAK